MYDKSHKAIAKAIEDNWGEDILIMAENLDKAKPTNQPWVRWSVRPADEFDSDVSAKYQRGIGVVYFQIFVPEDKGTRSAHEIARKIAGIFNRADLATEDGGAMRFDRAKLIYAGKSDGYVQHNCTVAYLEDSPALNAA